MTNRLVTIAGSDALAGGGIQADLSTFNEYGYQGLSVTTSIVTVFGDSFNVHAIESDLIAEQLASVFNVSDVAGVKTGLIPNREQFNVIASFLRENIYGRMPIVIDPVMVVKENAEWDLADIVALFKEQLFPIATIITPNLSEAELLVGHKIETPEDMQEAVVELHAMGPKNVVVKGGARLSGGLALDVVFDGCNITTLTNEKLDTHFNNGAGCTYAAAITAGLGNHQSVQSSVEDAKDFVYSSISNGIRLDETSELGNVWQAARRLIGGKHED